ncbi:hypothetical protein M752DRAFT_78774 [Aspergillus phoenicis ATCC 13157]|uniref:Uncharacterized protein n=1 Tax=Aspergillus phoenicis ATCC 13157 TaxID=1353007 RepID=A0A370P8B7_ASPPH|nr:hypothetical protein M752DRAFT_78774 [Aspergillus phoenicis ATCC 13157]
MSYLLYTHQCSWMARMLLEWYVNSRTITLLCLSFSPSLAAGLLALVGGRYGSLMQ